MFNYKINKTGESLKKLHEKWAKEKAVDIKRIAESGSYREYFRISGKGKTSIGVYNNDPNENKAFVSFTKHFLKKGLNVPELYDQNLSENIYLLKDLGDETLFSFAQKSKKSDLIGLYKRALEHLVKFQIKGARGLDYSVCYPRKSYDEQSVLWDLNYFKYYFLKLARIPFDEQKLENDFIDFSYLILKTDTNYFLYRDFQARNILLHDDELYFIDYQGGRKGALQYDVASILFQAQIDLSPSEREELLDHYLTVLAKEIEIKKKDFLKYYYYYVLIRLLQTFGAYGLRGFYENKTYFLRSVPFALKNLNWLIKNRLIPNKLPELRKVLAALAQNEELKKFDFEDANGLKVTINSFSYKKGLPIDYSGNGGGFVFDCRVLKNPGKYPKYFDLTGKDKAVIDFLEAESKVSDFLESVYSLVDDTVENYNRRNFKNLMINFGCTGGQHRSVYCAEKLASHLIDKFKANIDLNHTQLNRKD